MSAAVLVQPAQRAVSGAASATVAIAFGTNPTAANLLIAIWHANNSSGAVTGAITSTNNTWAVATGSTIQDANFQSQSGVSFAKNCAGGADTVTLTASGAGASGKQILTILEVSGMDTVSPNIAANAAKGTSSVPSGGNVTTTAPNAFIVASVATIANSCVQGTGYTQDFNAASYLFDVVEHRIETAANTFALAFANSTTFWHVTGAAFQEAAAAGAAVARRLTMIGAGA